MTSTHSLIVTLNTAPGVYLGQDDYYGKIKLGDVQTTNPTWPPWNTLPDILFNSISRTFVGLSFDVPQNSTNEIKELIHSLNSGAICYCDPVCDKQYQRYEKDESHYVEITWADETANAWALGQLADCGWYYKKRNGVIKINPNKNLECLLASDGVQLGKYTLAAFGLYDVQHVLSVYGLVLPSVYRFPVQSIESIVLG